MTGMLLINNLNQFDGVKKIRKIDEDNYSITVAIGTDKAGKVQYQKNGTTINGIQLKEDGTIYNDKTGNQLVEVERGSNSNGSYIKYSDGMLICYNTIYMTKSLTSAYEGSYFESIININYPISFVSAPTITATLQCQNALLSHTITNFTNNAFTMYLWKTQSKANLNINVHYIAIGRWK